MEGREERRWRGGEGGEEVDGRRGGGEKERDEKEEKRQQMGNIFKPLQQGFPTLGRQGKCKNKNK